MARPTSNSAVPTKPLLKTPVRIGKLDTAAVIGELRQLHEDAEDKNVGRMPADEELFGALLYLEAALVRAQNIRPKDTERLQQERNELAEALKKARRERNELREEVKRLVRIIHVLEVENDSLKSTSGARGGAVRVLPQRSAPPPPQR